MGRSPSGVRDDRAGIAAFAREVRATGAEGDTVARVLVAEAVEGLFWLAWAVRDRATSSDDPREFWNFPRAVVDGFGMGEALAELGYRIGFSPGELWGPPVLGAARCAAELVGQDSTPRRGMFCWRYGKCAYRIERRHRHAGRD